MLGRSEVSYSHHRPPRSAGSHRTAEEIARMLPTTTPAGAGTDGATAWARSLAEPHAVWDTGLGSPGFPESVRGRLAAGYATPHVEPKFRLHHDDAFFCIGSCFARVVERQL